MVTVCPAELATGGTLYHVLVGCGRLMLKVSRLIFFSRRRRHTILQGDWSSDVCSSDLGFPPLGSRPRTCRLPCCEVTGHRHSNKPPNPYGRHCRNPRPHIRSRSHSSEFPSLGSHPRSVHRPDCAAIGSCPPPRRSPEKDPACHPHRSRTSRRRCSIRFRRGFHLHSSTQTHSLPQ